MAPFYRWSSTTFRLQSQYVMTVNSEKYTLADCVLSINGYSNRGWGIHFHKFQFWRKVWSWNYAQLWQKETIDGIIWLKGKKVCNLQIRYYFCIAHVAQLMVSKMKFFCQRVIHRYPYRAIQRGITNFNTSGSWKMTMADWFYVTLGLDVWRNCSLCLRKRVKFQTWGTKIFLRKFYQT